MKRKKLLIAAGLALSAACYAQDNVTVNTASGKRSTRWTTSSQSRLMALP